MKNRSMFHFLSNYLKRIILTPILHSSFYILHLTDSSLFTLYFRKLRFPK